MVVVQMGPHVAISTVPVSPESLVAQVMDTDVLAFSRRSASKAQDESGPEVTGDRQQLDLTVVWLDAP